MPSYRSKLALTAALCAVAFSLPYLSLPPSLDGDSVAVEQWRYMAKGTSQAMWNWLVPPRPERTDLVQVWVPKETLQPPTELQEHMLEQIWVPEGMLPEWAFVDLEFKSYRIKSALLKGEIIRKERLVWPCTTDGPVCGLFFAGCEKWPKNPPHLRSRRGERIVGLSIDAHCASLPVQTGARLELFANTDGQTASVGEVRLLDIKRDADPPVASVLMRREMLSQLSSAPSRFGLALMHPLEGTGVDSHGPFAEKRLLVP